MSAKIDGAAWSAITRVTTLQSGTFIITGTGSINGNNVMAITVFGQTAATYTLDPGTSQLGFAANFTPKVGASTDSIYTAYQGTVVLSSVDLANKKISGTYNFKMRLTDMVTEINVTEGAFSNLSYTE
jgi:polyisoprenoid-binding protein YceI